MSISVHSSDLKSVSESGELYLGPTYYHSSNMAFHVKVWMEIENKSISDYVTLNINDDFDFEHKVCMAFKTKQDLVSFYLWWNEYSQRFGGIESALTTMLPTAKTGDVVSGTVIETVSISAQRTLFDQWIVILKNCASPVIYFNSYWLFEDPSDALIYKMKSPVESSNNDDDDDFAFFNEISLSPVQWCTLGTINDDEDDDSIW